MASTYWTLAMHQSLCWLLYKILLFSAVLGSEQNWVDRLISYIPPASIRHSLPCGTASPIISTLTQVLHFLSPRVHSFCGGSFSFFLAGQGFGAFLFQSGETEVWTQCFALAKQALSAWVPAPAPRVPSWCWTSFGCGQRYDGWHVSTIMLPYRIIDTCVSFLPLRQGTWGRWTEGGKVYFGSCFQRFQCMGSWPCCWRQHIVGESVWGSKAAHFMEAL
jgi:hypothetical protein